MLPTKTDIPLPGLGWLEWHPANNVHHPAIDLGIWGWSDLGQDIVNPKHGYVEYVSPAPSWWRNRNNGGFGWFIIIKHDDGKYTRHAHCKDIVAGNGKEVKAGQLIAHLGNTGASSGPHDHFEVFGEELADIQRKHWRKWCYYPKWKSKQWVVNHYLNPWEWLKKSDKIPDWASEDWGWAVKLGFAPTDPQKKMSMKQLLHEAGYIKSGDEPVPAYEIIVGLRKFVKGIKGE